MTRTIDDIVVGSGAGGAVVASRLSEDPDREVLLLEAGPDYASLAETPEDLRDPWISLNEHDWGLTAKTGDRTIPYPRGRVIGGSTAVNAAVATRGTVEDFELWVAKGCDQWSYSDVLPYYMKLETEEGGDPAYHGQSGPIWITTPKSDEWQPVSVAFAQSLVGMGYNLVPDHNEPGCTGVGPCSFNIRDGIRWSTSMAYLAPARDRPNLEIRAGTLVDRVLIEGGAAVGVRAVVDGHSEDIRAHRVTLAGGSIGTPCILQRSGIGAEAHLRTIGAAVEVDLPGVGANLMDHGSAGVAAVSRPGVQKDPRVYFEFFMRQGPQAMGLLTLWDRRPLAQFFGNPDNPPVISVSTGTWRPQSRGVVRAADLNPSAAPEIQLNFLTHPEDVRLAVAGLKLGLTILRGPEMKPFVETIVAPTPDVEADEDTMEAFLRAYCSTGFHPVGTAKMGTEDDPEAVCDQHGRVLGVSGLRVADASLMPIIVTAPTNLTSIMIGERVADWLRSESY